ncbi:hypothetical protein [Streptomyces sp. SD15]
MTTRPGVTRLRVTRPGVPRSGPGGPAPAAEAAEAVQRAAADANSALWRVTEGDPGARERFDEAHGVFRHRLAEFNEAARDAMTAS